MMLRLVLLTLLIPTTLLAKMPEIAVPSKLPTVKSINMFQGHISISYEKSQQVFGNYLFKNGTVSVLQKKKKITRNIDGTGALTFKNGKIIWLSSIDTGTKTTFEVIRFSTKLKRESGIHSWLLKSDKDQAMLWRMYGPNLQEIIKQNPGLSANISYFTSTINFQEINCNKKRQSEFLHCRIPFTITTPDMQSLGMIEKTIVAPNRAPEV